MTSTENPEQNEYEESFKRFKTLFIVGAACFCVGVTVVILGNRFQLYEVQRLGIIFSSFGIGWIVLAISYLVYMKWCFIPGESENTPQQVVQRNLDTEGSIVSRTLGRPPPSSNIPETPPSGNETLPGRHSSLAGKNFGRSTSLVQNLQRSSPSANGSEKRSLHMSRNFERRSYSVRNFRDRPYCRECKRLSESFKTSRSPLFSEINTAKRKPFVGIHGTTRESNCDELPLQSGEHEKTPSPATAPSERTPLPEKDYKSFSNHSERPLDDLKDIESQLSYLSKSKEQPLLANSSEEQMTLVKNSEKPSSFVKHFDGRATLVEDLETQTTTLGSYERPQSGEEKSYGKEPSLMKSGEKQPTLENYKRPVKHSCTCLANNRQESFPEKENRNIPPLIQKNSDAPQSCKIDLDTKSQRSCPPGYYDVVLSLQSADE